MNRLARPCGNPLRNLWSGPDAPIGWGTGEEEREFLLLRDREEGDCTFAMVASIGDSGPTLIAIALGDLPNGAWLVTRCRHNLRYWRSRR